MDLGSLSLCNTLPACKNLPIFMTYFSLKMVQSSCSRRKTVVGPLRAAMAESGKVGCRRESCSAGCAGSVAAGFGVTLQLWGNTGFLIFLHSCVTAACNHVCDVVPFGGLSTALEERHLQLSYSRRFRTSWFLSHAYAATSAALHSASHGYLFCLAFQGVCSLG